MIRYIPRNDFVLFRLIRTGKMGSLLAPQVSEEGMERIIIAVGPDVKDLKIGDRILAVGTVGQDVVRLPQAKDLYLTRQQNVVLVLEDIPDEQLAAEDRLGAQ